MSFLFLLSQEGAFALVFKSRHFPGEAVVARLVFTLTHTNARSDLSLCGLEHVVQGIHEFELSHPCEAIIHLIHRCSVVFVLAIMRDGCFVRAIIFMHCF